jgi:hypothetical protein
VGAAGSPGHDAFDHAGTRRKGGSIYMRPEPPAHDPARDDFTQLFAAALRQHDSDGVVGFPAKTGVSGVSPLPRA